jgi:hypothetical protein
MTNIDLTQIAYASARCPRRSIVMSAPYEMRRCLEASKRPQSGLLWARELDACGEDDNIAIVVRELSLRVNVRSKLSVNIFQIGACIDKRELPDEYFAKTTIFMDDFGQQAL